MRADVAAAVGGATVATPTSKGGAVVSGRFPTVDMAGWCERTTRAMGRVLIGLPPSTWLLADISILTLGVYVAYTTFPPPAPLETPHVPLWQALAVFNFALTLASLVFGLYERETIVSRSRILTRLLLTTATSIVIAYAIIYIIMYATVGRRVTGLAMSFFLIGGGLVRWCAWWAIHKVRRCLLIVGSKALFSSFVQAKKGDLLPEYEIAGYVAADTVSGDLDCQDEWNLGTITSEIVNLRKRGITDIVVSDEEARHPRVMEWMVPCLQHGCRVTNEAIFYEKATGQILVEEITPAWFLFADLQVHCDEQATLKRIVDLVTSVIGLCLSAPLWPLIALSIKLCDGGPAFYSQDRVGQNGAIFKLFKFRTMRTNAENGKSVWCAPNDPRITAVGRVLRKTRLDELPQLYNVLIGEMSIVGPRPERPDFVAELNEKIPFYAERHLVKPGVTGWAQISYHYGASIDDAKRKLQFDLYYLKHMSFEMDFIILFRTAGTFLRGAC